MKNLLITGGAGLIGSNLVKKLATNYNVYVADNLWRGKKENIIHKKKLLIPNKNFHKIDLSNYNNCLKVTKNIDIVIHLADIVAGINYVFNNEFFISTKSENKFKCFKSIYQK